MKNPHQYPEIAGNGQFARFNVFSFYCLHQALDNILVLLFIWQRSAGRRHSDIEKLEERSSRVDCQDHS
jgi:hypothetical protein